MSKTDAATIPAVTDDAWKDELFEAGEEVVRAQLSGSDTTTAMKRFMKLKEKLPESIQAKLHGPKDPELWFKVAKSGWALLKDTLEVRNRMR